MAGAEASSPEPAKIAWLCFSEAYASQVFVFWVHLDDLNIGTFATRTGDPFAPALGLFHGQLLGENLVFAQPPIRPCRQANDPSYNGRP
eukprot:1152332-Pelagomonas_calceolata.AAC.12